MLTHEQPIAIQMRRYLMAQLEREPAEPERFRRMTTAPTSRTIGYKMMFAPRWPGV